MVFGMGLDHRLVDEDGSSRVDFEDEALLTWLDCLRGCFKGVAIGAS